MVNRSPITVIVLSFLTLGIYGLVWLVKTKGEMVAKGADVPTAWLIIIPLVNIWWIWQYAQGVGHVTEGKTEPVLAFILVWVLGPIGIGIIQNEFNTKAAAPSLSDKVE